MVPKARHDHRIVRFDLLAYGAALGRDHLRGKERWLAFNVMDAPTYGSPAPLRIVGPT